MFYDFVLDGLKRVDCATAESRGQSDASALADIGYRCEIGKIKCTRNSLLSADPQTRSGSAASETVQLLQRLRTFILDVSQAAETEYRNALVQEAAELLTGTSIALLDHHDTTVSSLENLLWIALTIGSRPQLAHAGNLRRSIEVWVCKARIHSHDSDDASRSLLLPSSHFTEWLMSASRAVNQCFLKLSKYHEAVKWTDKAGSIVDMLEAVEMRASGTLTADQQHAFDAARQELVVFNLIATCFEKARSVYDEVERSKAARTQSTTTSKNHLPSSARASTAHAKALPAEEDLRKTFHASLETVIDEGVARMKGASAKLEFTLALFELTMSIPDETVDVEFAAETKRNLVHRLTMKALSMTETLRKDDPTMSAFQHNLGGVRRLSHALFRGSRRNDFTVLAKRLVELTVMAEEQLGFTFAPARNDALLLLAVDEWAHINKSAGIGTWEASQALMDMKKASDKIRRAITSLAAPMSTIDKETWKIASTALGYAWRACAVHIAAGLRTSNSSEQVLFASFLDSNGVLKTFVDFFDLVEHWPGSSDDESARLHMLLVLCQAMISLKRYTEAKKLIASGVRALQAQRKCYMRSNKSGIACDVLLQDEGLTLDYDEECAYEMACAESEFWILGCKVAIFEQEETRLKHIDKKRAAYARIGAKFQQQDDDDRFDNLAKALCGADQSRVRRAGRVVLFPTNTVHLHPQMAVFYITLLSLDDLALSTMQADACFESAHNALAACTSSERKLLHQLTNGALQILSRDDESIIVRSSAGPVQSAWIQVYCKQGITSSITSKDSSYVGTGVMARPRHPVVISGLVANQNYTVGIAFFDKSMV